MVLGGMTIGRRKLKHWKSILVPFFAPIIHVLIQNEFSKVIDGHCRRQSVPKLKFSWRMLFSKLNYHVTLLTAERKM
jgi:hypothetical protein